MSIYAHHVASIIAQWLGESPDEAVRLAHLMTRTELMAVTNLTRGDRWDGVTRLVEMLYVAEVRSTPLLAPEIGEHGRRRLTSARQIAAKGTSWLVRQACP